jgi:hypothetical protein
MTLPDWHTVPVVLMPVDELIPTQNAVLIDHLIRLSQGGSRHEGDICGHVVRYRGRHYIHDGHHEWTLRWLRGHTHIPVRVIRIDQPCTAPCCR